MKNFKIALFLFSALGLFMSMAVHFSLFWNVNVQDMAISPFFLHLGIFLVFIPSLIIFLYENKENKDEEGRKNVKKILFQDSPRLLSGILFITYIYAIINFILFIGYLPGGPTVIDGKYVLSNHGNIVKEISFEEYQYYKRREVRGFSGHWMLFFSGAMLLSYPFRKKKDSSKLVEREIINEINLKEMSFENRLYEKGQFLFILSAISVPLFIFFLFYSPHFMLLAVTGIFPLNLLLNLYYFLQWSKYFIKSYSIEGSSINIEVYSYNTLLKYKFEINEINIKLNEKPLRGANLVYITFFNMENKEIFSQFESSIWNPNLLRDLERAVNLVKEKNSNL